MKYVIAVVATVLIIGGVWWYFNKTDYKTTSDSTTSETTTTASPSDSTTSAVNVAVATIDNMAFSPATLFVKTGTTVTWTNNDSVSHTVTADSGATKTALSDFASGTVKAGGTYSYTFTKAGTWGYYCEIHPSMTAKVVVTE